MKQLTAIVFLMVALLPRTAEGQCHSSQKKPAWADGYFDALTNSYVEMASATGRTEGEARNKAAHVVMERRGIATGQQVNVRVQNGNVVVTGGSSLEVKARVIDEYREQCGRDEHRVSLLVQTVINPSFQPDRVRVTDEYPFSARVFVPGMAQFHKGSTGKGVFFITGEVVFIIMAMAFDGARRSNELEYSMLSDGNKNESYGRNLLQGADGYKTTRNVFIVAAAALYAWNIIDGATAKGKKHVQILGMNNMNISPFVTAQYGSFGSGISLTWNF